MLAVREGLAGTGWREGLAGGGGYVPACKFVAAFFLLHPAFFCVLHRRLRLRLSSRQKKLYAWADECAVVFLLVLVARTQLRPVDVGELERLRYRYKGA